MIHLSVAPARLVTSFSSRLTGHLAIRHISNLRAANFFPVAQQHDPPSLSFVFFFFPRNLQQPPPCPQDKQLRPQEAGDAWRVQWVGAVPCVQSVKCLPVPYGTGRDWCLPHGQLLCSGKMKKWTIVCFYEAGWKDALGCSNCHAGALAHLGDVCILIGPAPQVSPPAGHLALVLYQSRPFFRELVLISMLTYGIGQSELLFFFLSIIAKICSRNKFFFFLHPLIFLIFFFLKLACFSVVQLLFSSGI